MAARAISSGTISFGLVSIPIKLYTAASPKSVSFNMLTPTGGRVKQQYVDAITGEVVDRASMTKGYEHARDQFVVFTEEELKKLDSPKTNQLELIEFVPKASVDPIHIEKSYYLGPDKGGDRAYRLLAQSLEQTDKFAVGRFNTRGKDQLVLVRAYRGGLMLHQVYYADEVRAWDEVDTGATFTYREIELDLAARLVEQLSVDAFDPSKYSDEYAARVLAAVDQKVAGAEITVAPAQPHAVVIDLLEALKRSLQGAASPSAPEPEQPGEPAVAAAAVKGGPKKAAPRQPQARKKGATG
jgi:DNA end-binding protein Ku